VFPFAVPWDILMNPKLYLAFAYMVLYFIGGYVLFGSLYAACGAITDKDNENQAYMTVITFILLGAFYIGQYAVDHGASAFATACNYIPFTSPTVGTINAISGVSPLWQTLLSIVILYAGAAVCVVFAGKLYRSSMLLKGKQFSPKDIITFIRTS
ncbi:MAG: ABC transporter permease, partial [Muribaculaceae bacterium]|nr:ABC transporter permease [Muribaculaceae bacterium]